MPEVELSAYLYWKATTVGEGGPRRITIKNHSASTLVPGRLKREANAYHALSAVPVPQIPGHMEVVVTIKDECHGGVVADQIPASETYVYESGPMRIRKTIGNSMCDYVGTLRSFEPPNVGAETPNFINVLLFGLSGATKSSFINSILTLLSAGQDEIVQNAVAGGQPGHVTKELKPYPLSLGEAQLKIRLWDTWGLTLKNYAGEELPFILRGDLPPDFAMDADLESIRGQVKNSFLRRIHSVIVFIPVAVLSDPMAQNFRQSMCSHIGTLREFDLEPIIILSKVDEVNNRVRSAPNIKYPDLEQHRQRAAKLFGVSISNVLYGINYFSKSRRNFEIDRLNYITLEKALVLAMKHLTVAAQVQCWPTPGGVSFDMSVLHLARERMLATHQAMSTLDKQSQLLRMLERIPDTIPLTPSEVLAEADKRYEQLVSAANWSTATMQCVAARDESLVVLGTSLARLMEGVQADLETTKQQQTFIRHARSLLSTELEKSARATLKPSNAIEITDNALKRVRTAVIPAAERVARAERELLEACRAMQAICIDDLHLASATASDTIWASLQAFETRVPPDRMAHLEELQSALKARQAEVGAVMQSAESARPIHATLPLLRRTLVEARKTRRIALAELENARDEGLAHAKSLEAVLRKREEEERAAQTAVDSAISTLSGDPLLMRFFPELARPSAVLAPVKNKPIPTPDDTCCKVCYDAKINTVIIPCTIFSSPLQLLSLSLTEINSGGHMAMCFVCGNLIKERAKKNECMKAFMASSLLMLIRSNM